MTHDTDSCPQRAGAGRVGGQWSDVVRFSERFPLDDVTVTVNRDRTRRARVFARDSVEDDVWTELNILADDLEAEHVVRALGEGWSWTRVAEALEVTRQAVQKKHGHRIRPTH